MTSLAYVSDLKGDCFWCTIYPPSFLVLALVFSEIRGGGRISPPPPNPVPEDQKKPSLNRINRQLPGDVFDNNQRWHAINRDSKKLEKLCKGKPPESTSEMIQLLSEGDIDDIPVLAYGPRDWNWNWPIRAQYAGQTEFSYVIRREDPGNEVVACSVEHRRASCLCTFVLIPAMSAMPSTPVILVRFTFIYMNAGKQVLISMQL